MLAAVLLAMLAAVRWMVAHPLAGISSRLPRLGAVRAGQAVPHLPVVQEQEGPLLAVQGPEADPPPRCLPRPQGQAVADPGMEREGVGLMACGGLHCAGCGGGSVAPVLAFAAFCGVDWVVTHIVEVAIVSATCGVLAVAAMVALMRWADRRDARHVAMGPLMVTRAAAAPVVTARVIPQVSQGTAPPAIVNHYHVHFDPADREAARIIRQALPGLAGDARSPRE